MKASEALKKAKALIDSPDKWTKKAYAKDSEGDRLIIHESGKVVSIPKGVENTVPACFCSIGAVLYTCKDEDLAEEAKTYLCEAVSVEDESYIFVFNDKHEHPDIMQMFDKAIQLAEEKECATGSNS